MEIITEKNIITELITSTEGFDSRLNRAEELSSKPEEGSVGNTQSEAQREKKEKCRKDCKSYAVQ